MSERHTPAGRASPVTEGIRYHREHQRLIEYVRAKRDVGTISEEDAKALEEVKEILYREHGLWREPGDQNAIHSATDVLAAVAVERHCRHLLEQKLLALYPELTAEVRGLFDLPRSL